MLEMLGLPRPPIGGGGGGGGGREEVDISGVGGGVLGGMLDGTELDVSELASEALAT